MFLLLERPVPVAVPDLITTVEQELQLRGFAVAPSVCSGAVVDDLLKAIRGRVRELLKFYNVPYNEECAGLRDITTLCNSTPKAHWDVGLCLWETWA